MKKVIVLCVVGLMVGVTSLFAAPGDLVVNGGSAQVTQYGYTSLIGGNNIHWNGFKSNAPTGIWGFQQSERAFFGVPGNIYSLGFSPNAIGVLNGSTTAEDIVLFNKNGADAGYLVLKAGGNVGIGTTNPTAKLSVGGDGIINVAVYGNNGTGTGVYGNSGTGYGVYGNSATTGVYGNSSGQYGYGVYGYSLGSNAYAVFCYSAVNLNGCGGNRAWYYSSDETLKENIAIVSGALPRIMQLRGVSFNWKTDPEKKRQIGMLAQEVKAVIPEAVGQDPDGNLTLSDGPIVSLLTEAIKEQQKQIDLLRVEIEKLKNAQ